MAKKKAQRKRSKLLLVEWHDTAPRGLAWLHTHMKHGDNEIHEVCRDKLAAFIAPMRLPTRKERRKVFRLTEV